MIRNIYLRLLPLLFLGIISIQCSEDELSNEKVSLSQTELQTVLDSDADASTMDTVLAEIYATAGKSGKTLKTNDCYDVAYTENGFVANFNNCVLNTTDNANGTVTINYSGTENNGTFTAVYEDFYVNGTKLNGSRTITLVGDITNSSIALGTDSDLEIEMENGDLVRLSGNRSFSLNFNEDLFNSTYEITGSWNLTKNGTIYEVQVEDALSGTWAVRPSLPVL